MNLDKGSPIACHIIVRDYHLVDLTNILFCLPLEYLFNY